MKETTYRTLVLLLLFVSVAVQILILIRVPGRPVVWSDIYGKEGGAKSQARRVEIMHQIPLARVFDSVDVEIKTDPVPVEIQR